MCLRYSCSLKAAGIFNSWFIRIEAGTVLLIRSSILLTPITFSIAFVSASSGPIWRGINSVDCCSKRAGFCFRYIISIFIHLQVFAFEIAFFLTKVFADTLYIGGCKPRWIIFAAIGTLQAINFFKGLFIQIGQLLQHFIFIGPVQKFFILFLPLPWFLLPVFQ